MALQNIGASNKDDTFYRYKMPKMLTKIEGRGNGIKTNIVNMVDIAKALARPASYTTKYFDCELGAQSKFDERTGISIVYGAHDTAKLAGLVVFLRTSSRIMSSVLSVTTLRQRSSSLTSRLFI
jgi:translation initiation factor 5